MKAGYCSFLALLATGAVSAVLAQEQPKNAVGSTNAPPLVPVLQYDLGSTNGQPSEPSSDQKTVRATTTVEVSGPIVRPLKAKRFSDGLKDFAQLFNPFAPVEPTEPITKVGKLSSRPWTAVVGWTPGQSAFPDERTDVPTLTLISVAPR